jgi:hypothetical protein
MEQSEKDKKGNMEKLKLNKMLSPLLKIVLVGDSEVGKTSIISTFVVLFYIKLIERWLSKREI